MKRVLTALAATLPFAAHAADAITGEVQRQPTNWQAIVMFLIFVLLTLYITYWASKRVRSRNDYYTAGGNITGFQNGLAIAGDFMSAASFLGISALVYTSGYDGLIYSLGFLVGWPIILFLIGLPVVGLSVTLTREAEPLIAELRAQAELAQMRVLQKGNRLSITPVDEEEWRCITALLDR